MSIEQSEKKEEAFEIEEPKRKRFFMERNEILILIGIFFLGFSTAMFSPYAPIWLENIFDVDSYFILGFVTIIPNLLVAIGTTVWGILADRFGKRKFVLLGFLASGLMYFALLFVNTSIMFLLVMLIGYMFISAQTSNVYAYATLTSSKTKETILGGITATFSIAWGVSSPIAGSIHDAAKNPDTFVSKLSSVLPDAFSQEIISNPDMGLQLFIAVFVCLVAFLVILFSKEEEKSETQREVDKSKIKGVKITIFPIIFILIVITAFFQFANSSGFWSFASVYFINTLNTSAIHFSYFLVGTTILGSILALLLGRITKIGKILLCIIAGMMVQVTIYSLMTAFPSKIILGLVVYSFPSYVISNVSLYSLAGTFSNKLRRATAYGLYNTIGLSGAISATLILGLLADSSLANYFSEEIFIMLPATLVLAALAFIISLVLAFFIRRKKELI